MPCRRDLEASATVETLSSTTRRRHRTRAEPEERVDLRHPKAPPEDPLYTSHDRTLSEPRDLYVTDVPRRRLTLIVGFRRLVVGTPIGQALIQSRPPSTSPRGGRGTAESRRLIQI